MANSIFVEQLFTSNGGQLSSSVSSVNDNTTKALSTTSSALVVTQNLTGGTDESIATTYVAGSFIVPVAEIGGFILRLRRDAGTSAGNVRLTVRADNAGVPSNSDLTWREPTGQPTIVYASDLATSYASFTFRAPLTGLTPAATYWFVLQLTGLAGGNIYWDRQTAASNLYATSSNGSSWSGATKQPYYQVLGSTGAAVYGSSDTDWGGYFTSGAGIAVRGIGTRGPGAKFDSTDNFGVGGTSVNDAGVRGSSVSSIAGIFVSTGSAGLQAQTTAAGQVGAQTVSTTGVSTQLVSTTGGALQYLALDATVGGAVWTDGCVGEEITLSGSATTDSVGSLLPAGSLIYAVVWRITVGITGAATAFQIGTAVDAVNFEATNSTIVLGTAGFGINHLLTGGHPLGFAAATKVRITLNSTSTAGKIRVVVYYRAFTSPTA